MKYMADDYEQDQGPNMTLIYMALIMSTVILVVVGMMFLVNKPTKSSSMEAMHIRLQPQGRTIRHRLWLTV